MAGDWIKVEQVTQAKPEVLTMAALLNVTDNEILGGLIRFWVWADQQSLNGDALSVTKALIDRVANVAGLADAMQTVGWLVEKEGHLSMVNFDRHNGQTAKRRALTARRNAKYRLNAIVTQTASPREEKRRVLNTSTCTHPTFQQTSTDPTVLTTLRKAYPHLALDGEILKMGAWLAANPTKARKTNWRRFMTNWCANAKGVQTDATSRRSFSPEGAAQLERERRQRAESGATALRTDSTPMVPGRPQGDSRS